MKKIVHLCFLIVCIGAFSSCTNQNAQETKQTKEYTSEYICPMHCEGSGSDSAGLCPTCGMDYVINPKNEK